MSKQAELVNVDETARPPASRKRQILVIGASISLSVGVLAPIAKAGPMDQLTQTLSSTVNGAVNQTIGGISGSQGSWSEIPGGSTGKAINQTIDGILGSQGQWSEIPGIGGILNGGGITRGGGFSLPDPFAALSRSFDSFLKDILTGAIGSQGPWSEIPGSGAGGDVGNGANQDGGLPIDQPVIDMGGGFNFPINKPILDLGGIGVKTGALGLPDIIATHQSLDQIAKGMNQAQAKALDQFNINPIAVAYSAKAEADRVANKGVATTVIGTQGQQQMKAEAENASKVLDTIQVLNTDAQKKDVTQDVMKNLSAMSYGQASLSAGSYAELMGLRQQTAANSVVTANISEGIDESNRRDHAERMGAAISVLNAAGSTYLPGQEK
jgi:hypothetical protein